MPASGSTGSIIDTPLSTRYPIYTRFNANDVLPDPVTPLAASMCWTPQIMPGWWAGYAIAGAFSAEEFRAADGSAACGFTYGRLYINQTTVRILGVRGGIGWQAVDTAFFGGPEAGAPAHEENPADENPAASAAMIAQAQWALTTTTFDDLEEERLIADGIRDRRPDLSAMSKPALVAYARSLMPVERLMWRGETGAGSPAATGPAVASAILGPAGADLVAVLIANAGDVDSAAPTFALWDLSRIVAADPSLMREFDRGVDGLHERLTTMFPDFAGALQQFLREFGYRGPSEWDLGSPSWETHPELPLGLVDRLRLLPDDRSPAQTMTAAQRAEEVAWARAQEILGGDADTVAALRGAVTSGKRFQAWRERAKANCIKVLHEARLPLLELGRRLHESGDLARPALVFMALDDEFDVLALDGAARGLNGALEVRERQWRALFDIQEPLFIDARLPLPPIAELPRRSAPTAPRAQVGDVLRGSPASFGTATGTVRIVTDLSQVSDFQPGEILVAPQTDPSWTPLFMVAAAVVVDVGSLSSHAVIVSRELGIPCAAGVAAATLRLRSGDTVEVDATAGTVRVLTTA